VLTVDADNAFAAWASATLGAREARLGEALGGGNANVTRVAVIDGERLVLRHPPVHTVSDRAAAGIRREYDLMRAVAGRAPVPEPVAFCDDAAVLGAPFLLASFIDGVAITETLPASYPDSTATVRQIGEELVDALAAVHRIEWHGTLPEGFGRPAGFVQRQIERWLAVRRKDAVRPLPMLEELGQWLLDHLPEDDPATIIHCDYHLDNTLFARTDPRLMAIVDWEMATVGPPLVDVGLLTMFWNRADGQDRGFPAIQAVSNRADAPSGEELARRWSAATGFPITNLAYYQAFAFWRLAAIVEGAHVLSERGLVDTPYARGLTSDVPALLAEAARAAGIDARDEEAGQ
jgi:aminoglycoside phosphotransferase (APT) family kinase protein